MSIPSPHTLPKRATQLTLCLLLLLMVFGLALLAMSVGAVSMPIKQVFAGLFGGPDQFIIQEYRLPRVVVSALAGASFALAGLFLQAALRNPLASPDIVGVTKGAGLGALLVVIFVPPALQIWAIPVGVIVGALLATALLLGIARALNSGITTLALIGVSIGALAQAVMYYLMVSYPNSADQSMVWLAGSVYGSTQSDIGFLSLWLLLSLPITLWIATKLDLASFGDDTLTGLGLSGHTLRLALIGGAVILTAGAVASVGSMGFLGLLAPHIARLMVGPRATYLVPSTVLVGALALMLADFLGRIIALPNEIPAGIVTSIIGGPYLLFLLIWEGRQHDS